MICLMPILINFYLPYTKADIQVIERAAYVCKTRYKACTKKIIKQGPLAYHVICFDKDGK